MSTRTIIAVVIALGFSANGVVAGEAPKVVKTVPASDATDVNPNLDQVVLTFDSPIKTSSHSLVVLGDLKFPELAGDDPISFPDNKTCVVKVKLQPETAYGLGINSATRTGFKSAEDGTPAKPFELRFKTTTADKAGAIRVPVEPQGPHVVKTDPPNGASGIEAGTFDLTIVFSEPMKKGQASIITPPDGPRLKPVGKPRWEDARTFVAPVMLEAAQNYRLGINVIEPKRFVTAGDDTPADPFELKFSTKGAPPIGKETTRPSSMAAVDGEGSGSRVPSEVQLRYNYQKGDSGRVIRKAILDMKLSASNGQAMPIGNKMGLNCIEEVLAVENGQPVEVRKVISEYVMMQTDPQTGQSQAAPKLEEPVTVKVDRRTDPPEVTAISGEVPKELMELLSQDTFPDLLPSGVIKVGQKYDLPAKTVTEIKKAFDTTGTGHCEIKLTAQRIGLLEVQDARNEMFKAKGGGELTTYLLNVVEFGLDWKQDGTMQGGVPFDMEARGKVVFAIEAGVLLTSDVDAKITIKPVQTQDQNGQAITVSGGGTYTIHNSFEPINWTRGAKRKGGKVMVTPATETTDTAAKMGKESIPVDPSAKVHVSEASMCTPTGSIAYQLSLLRKGDVEALKECFTEDVRDRITLATVKAGQANARQAVIEDLVSEVSESEGLGSSKSAKIKMKNGRTLTTLVFTNGKWLAETVWFK